MEWLTRPLVADGHVVAGSLAPTRLTDADLRGICLRMHAILDTVEMPRCEGRLIPVHLFDAIDTLESMVCHGLPTPPRLADWVGVIREFGEYYGLAGVGPIAVDPVLWREVVSRFGAIADAQHNPRPTDPNQTDNTRAN